MGIDEILIHLFSHIDGDVTEHIRGLRAVVDGHNVLTLRNLVWVDELVAEECYRLQAGVETEGALADLLNFRRDTDVGESLAALVEGVVANLRERWGQQGEVFAGHSRREQFECALVLRAEVALYARVARVVLVHDKFFQLQTTLECSRADESGRLWQRDRLEHVTVAEGFRFDGNDLAWNGDALQSAVGKGTFEDVLEGCILGKFHLLQVFTIAESLITNGFDRLREVDVFERSVSVESTGIN